MKIIVDTCVWSLALRRRVSKSNAYVEELKNLIEEVRVQLIGPIRQELLSGIKSKKQFHTLKLHLETFEDIEIQREDYELAAEYFNIAQSKGIQGSSTYFLICAISSRHNMPILSTDKDFVNFNSVIPIDLHSPIA
jgi:predicted nucleic acid-binding protein